MGKMFQKEITGENACVGEDHYGRSLYLLPLLGKTLVINPEEISSQYTMKHPCKYS